MSDEARHWYLKYETLFVQNQELKLQYGERQETISILLAEVQKLNHVINTSTRQVYNQE